MSVIFDTLREALQAASIKYADSERLDRASASPFFVTLRLGTAERSYTRVLDVALVDVMVAPTATAEDASDARRRVAEAIMADGRCWIGAFAANAVGEEHGKREFNRWRVEARLLDMTGEYTLPGSPPPIVVTRLGGLAIDNSVWFPEGDPAASPPTPNGLLIAGYGNYIRLVSDSIGVRVGRDPARRVDTMGYTIAQWRSDAEGIVASGSGLRFRQTQTDEGPRVEISGTSTTRVSTSGAEYQRSPLPFTDPLANVSVTDAPPQNLLLPLAGPVASMQLSPIYKRSAELRYGSVFPADLRDYGGARARIRIYANGNLLASSLVSDIPEGEQTALSNWVDSTRTLGSGAWRDIRVTIDRSRTQIRSTGFTRYRLVRVSADLSGDR